MAPVERPAPLPADFTLRFSPRVRRPRPAVLIGGAPTRVLKLTPAGAERVAGWLAGQPVGPGTGAGALAALLVDAGLAFPVPPDEPAGAPPVTTIVIPVRDDAGGLAVTTAALSSAPPEVGVVVVDDGSRVPIDGAAIHRPSPGGPAAARNAGARLAGPDAGILVFVDAGCAPEGRWLETLLAHFADPRLAAVAPRVMSRPSPGTPPALARYESARSPLDLGPVGAPVHPGSRVPYVPSAVLAVRAQAFLELGGFDEKLRFGEDVDLVWRLAAAGWRVRYEPAAAATHPTRTGHRRWLRQRFEYGSSAAPLAARHGRSAAPLMASPWSVAAWAFAAAGHPEAGALITAGSARVLARRAGSDAALAGELRRLAVHGTIRSAGPIASAIRRAWLPPALIVAIAASSVAGRRTRRSLGAAAVSVVVAPGLADWSNQHRAGRPTGGPLTWTAWCLADDLAYQAGVWAGVIRQRSAAALLPKW